MKHGKIKKRLIGVAAALVILAMLYRPVARIYLSMNGAETGSIKLLGEETIHVHPVALFETTIINAETKEEARILAKSVIGSSLCKAAIYGHDANFGRFLCALGYSGVIFDPQKMELYFESEAGKLLIYKDGMAADYSEEEATKILSEQEVTVLVDMKMGSECATAWGCDLTYDYVKINADYRS